MKRRTEIKTKTYEADYGFMVDIVDDVDRRCGEAVWSVYLYREDLSVKVFMFGLLKSATPTLREVVGIVKANLPEYYGDYDEEYARYDDVDRSYADDYPEIYKNDGADCDCENCHYHDEDCDHCDECEDADDDGIEYPEDGSTPIATIKMCKLIGTEEEIEQAQELREKYFDNLHDTFVTESHYGLLQFARWAAQRFNMASFWISMADSYDDMMNTAVLMHIWFTETSGNTEQKGA